MGKIIQQGRLVFGIAIAASGAEGLICAHLQRAVRGVPWFPANPVLEYLCGTILLAGGLSIAFNVRARLVSSLLGILFLVFVLVNELPQALAKPLDLGVRTVFFEALSIGAAALTLAGTLRSVESRARPWNWFVDVLCSSGPCLSAISLVVFGIDHFLILDFVASLVPAWLPWHLFWAYLTGAAFVAGGISIAVKCLDLWAGALAGHNVCDLVSDPALSESRDGVSLSQSERAGRVVERVHCSGHMRRVLDLCL
jgi:hypothetical protein